MMVFVYVYILHVVYTFVFFFFKQKTAYEMRISDWSSDVCSSDLPDRRRASTNAMPVTPPTASTISASEAGMITIEADWLSAFFRLAVIGLELAGKIGRASCRERVCQYV